MNRSVPMGTALEFLELKPLNPLISKSTVKVLYEGKNRNRSYISKEVGDKMANSLPGTPVVGEYLMEAGDFGDHGSKDLVIDEKGIRFVKSTVPYGFVPLDAKVWWQEFMDADGVTRNYLCTEAFLWTGRYPETQRVIEKGNGQSMELEESMLAGEWSEVKGEWSKTENDDTEYFIISDAVFSALCILGEQVEPCFEGASIAKSGAKVAYSLDQDNFKQQMLDFMADLKDALNNLKNEGGQTVDILDLNEPVIETPETEEVEATVVPEVEEAAATPEEAGTVEGESGSEEFAKKNKKDEEEEDTTEEDTTSEDAPADDSSDEEDKKKKKSKYELEEVVEYQELLVQFNELQSQFSSIEAELSTIKSENATLTAFKCAIEDKEKDSMINSFYMLSDEDKAEVISKKTEFSLEEIESKLSVICVRKKVNFDLEDSSENESKVETPITTFSVDNSHDSTPAWLKAVENITKNRK